MTARDTDKSSAEHCSEGSHWFVDGVCVDCGYLGKRRREALLDEGIAAARATLDQADDDTPDSVLLLARTVVALVDGGQR